MPVESTFPLLSPQSCVWVGVRARVCACEWVSVCVYCTNPVSFFPVSFALLNDLLFSGFSFLFWKCVRFCLCFCCCLFLFVVCSCMFIAVSYQMFFHWCSFMYLHWGFWNKLRDLINTDVPSTARHSAVRGHATLTIIERDLLGLKLPPCVVSTTWVSGFTASRFWHSLKCLSLGVFFGLVSYVRREHVHHRSVVLNQKQKQKTQTTTTKTNNPKQQQKQQPTTKRKL